jgi:integrase
MPRLALTRVGLITTTMIRRIITETEWASPGVKRNALVWLSTILKAAVRDGLITRNPTAVLEPAEAFPQGGGPLQPRRG